MQTSVNDAPAQAYEGMVHTVAHENFIGSHPASGSVFYGKAVGLYDDNEVDIGDQRVKLPAAAGDVAVTNFKGVAIADTSLEATDNDYGEYVDKDMVPTMKKGQIWVKSVDAIDDITKGVYVRTANGAADPSAGWTLGSFRATVDADYTQLGDGVKWAGGIQIGSDYYGLLDLNLVP